MKIAISSTGQKLDDDLDKRFGRCAYFIVVDSENLEYEAVENPGKQAMGGAGTVAVQSVASKGVEAVVTGDCGPKAYESLKAAGIRVFTGASGSVRDSIDQFKKDSLQEANGPTSPPHAGMR